MKKTLTLILCLLYTFITFGGSIFVHNCGDDVMLSMYEKSSHENCPICAKKKQKKTSNCKHGSCNDVEIKIDQLKDKFTSSHKIDTIILQPVIFERLWINLYTPNSVSIINESLPYIHLYCSNSSPPAYILHCNIRN